MKLLVGGVARLVRGTHVGIEDKTKHETPRSTLIITVVFGRRWRSTMSSTGKAIRSSSTVTTFSKPSLQQDQGSKAGQFWEMPLG